MKATAGKYMHIFLYADKRLTLLKERISPADRTGYPFLFYMGNKKINIVNHSKKSGNNAN